MFVYTVGKLLYKHTHPLWRYQIPTSNRPLSSGPAWTLWYSGIPLRCDRPRKPRSCMCVGERRAIDLWCPSSSLPPSHLLQPVTSPTAYPTLTLPQLCLIWLINGVTSFNYIFQGTSQWSTGYLGNMGPIGMLTWKLFFEKVRWYYVISLYLSVDLSWSSAKKNCQISRLVQELL